MHHDHPDLTHDMFWNTSDFNLPDLNKMNSGDIGSDLQYPDQSGDKFIGSLANFDLNESKLNIPFLHRSSVLRHRNSSVSGSYVVPSLTF